MEETKTFYQRNMPHFQPSGYTYFVTFRLANSLPNHIVLKLREDYKEHLKQLSHLENSKEKTQKYYGFQDDYFAEFDRHLDTYHKSPCWLADEKIAGITKNAIHFYDKKNYDLICYCIMPNHVHLILTPIADQISDSAVALNKSRNGPPETDSRYIVTAILQNIKKFTAVKCNKILNRSGSFWQHESYDHVVRDEKELVRFFNYTLNNPVKANLVNTPEEWRWSYCKYL